MDELVGALDGARVVVVIGTGGVGKTTTAAALALALARRGRRVFVLTVDPARRLADALGLSLSDAGVDVALPPTWSGRVHAAMLETQRGWEAAVERLAPDPARRAEILGNRVFRAFSRTLARSHAYLAMERLSAELEALDAEGAPRWDVVVVDTPPMQNALDVLDAPVALGRFVEGRIVSTWLGGRTGFATGARAVRAVLSLVMGASLADELTGFLAAFAPLREGFASRSASLRALFASTRTRLVLVAGTSDAQGRDASRLADEVRVRGLSIAALVLPRARPASPPGLASSRDLVALRAWLDAGRGLGEEQREAVMEAVEAEREDARRAWARLEARRRALDVPLAIANEPLVDEPCSVEALLAFADAMRVVP